MIYIYTEVVGSNLARGEIFTASIRSFVKLYFGISHIFVSLVGSIRLLFANEIDANQYTTCTTLAVVNISAT